MAEFPYALTGHARRVLVERDIRPEWVARVLGAPDRIEPDPADPALRHALGAVAERDGRVLRVVYNETVRPWRVVTAYFDRRERSRR